MRTGNTAVFVALLNSVFISFLEAAPAAESKLGIPSGEAVYSENLVCDAAEENNLEELELLLRGANPNGEWKRAKTPLMYAAEKGNVEAAAFLLDKGAEVDMWSPGFSNASSGGLYSVPIGAGKTALMFAAENGKEGIVRLLLERGADPKRISANGGNLMHFAATGGNVKVMELFASLGIPADAATGNGITPLMSAAAKGHPEAVLWLLKHGAKVNAKATHLKKTAFLYAAGEGRTECAKILFKHGANIDSTCEDGYTALMAAAEGGHLETVKFLIDNGANASAKMNDWGYTALRFARDGLFSADYKASLDKGNAQANLKKENFIKINEILESKTKSEPSE